MRCEERPTRVPWTSTCQMLEPRRRLGPSGDLEATETQCTRLVITEIYAMHTERSLVQSFGSLWRMSIVKRLVADYVDLPHLRHRQRLLRLNVVVCGLVSRWKLLAGRSVMRIESAAG